MNAACADPVIKMVTTGHLRMKVAQQREGWAAAARILAGREWTPWLPVHVWIVRHGDAVFVIDTGETARVDEPGYLPRWHPYFRTSLRHRIDRDDEIDRHLHRFGLAPGDVTAVVLTHFHGDHVGGLRHFEGVPILATKAAHDASRGMAARLNGYLPQHLPDWLAPRWLAFDGPAIGPFERSHALMPDGAVLIVETRGHAPGHVSVLVRRGGGLVMLAGDTSYTQAQLVARRADAVAHDEAAMRDTHDRILALAARQPLVYLPSHDPEAPKRLAEGSAINGPGARSF